MSKKLRALIVTLIVASVLLLPAGTAWADMGGFSGSSDYSSSYDSGSSYSYDSGSSWGSGSYSYSWDDDDDDDRSYSWDDDDDDYGSSSGGGSSSSGGGDSDEGFEVAFALLMLFMIALIAFGFLRKGKSTGNTAAKAPVHITDDFDASGFQPVSTLRNVDPGFDEKAMREKLGDWYVKMQHAWTAKDMEELRPIFTDALFSQFDSQLDSLRNRKQTNYVDDIVIEGVELQGWHDGNDTQSLVAQIKAAIVDYTVADEGGRLISGSKTDVKHMTYRWILSRSKGVTSGAGGMTQVSCPNCGAALQINQTSRCPYCDSIVTLETHDWVINRIQGLEQRTEKRG